ncbi:MAG: hypothetical protein AAF989_08325, partial [Planctomycetota bacterium]
MFRWGAGQPILPLPESPSHACCSTIGCFFVSVFRCICRLCAVYLSGSVNWLQIIEDDHLNCFVKGACFFFINSV